MKRFNKILFLLVMVCAFFSLAWAQVEEPVEVDISKAADIFYLGIAGIGVLGLVQMVKKFFKTVQGWLTVLVSIAVSGAATGYYMVTTQGFDLLKFVIYTAVVALAANGIYLFPRRRTT